MAAGLLALLAPTASHAITNGDTDRLVTPTSARSSSRSPTPAAAPTSSQLCTGTVVSPRVVLTASHCMDRGDYAPDWGKVWFTLEQEIGDGTSWTLDDDLVLL